MPKPRISTSRASEAYDLLRQDLMDGTFAPGTKLVIADLQDRYDLGAMPLREALNRLSAEQFVQKHEQRGFAVPPLEATLFLEIQNARIVVESAALRESIFWHSPEWENRLVLAFHHLAKSARGGPEYLLSDGWARAHGVFHRALISGCSNEWLLTFANQLYEQSARYRARRRQIDARAPGALVDEHAAIMDAAIRGEADAAADRLIDHYRRSVETVLGEPVNLTLSPLKFHRLASGAATRAAAARDAPPPHAAADPAPEGGPS